MLLNLYETSTTAPPEDDGPGTVTYPYQAMGCFSEPTGARALSQVYSSTSMTHDVCFQFCGIQGYSYAGLEVSSSHSKGLDPGADYPLEPRAVLVLRPRAPGLPRSGRQQRSKRFEKEILTHEPAVRAGVLVRQRHHGRHEQGRRRLHRAVQGQPRRDVRRRQHHPAVQPAADVVSGPLWVSSLRLLKLLSGRCWGGSAMNNKRGVMMMRCSGKRGG
jgi:hypothetical protein